MSNKMKSWVLLLVLSLVWGGSFMLMKRAMFALDGTPIFNEVQVASLRMLLASVVLVPIALKSISKVDSMRLFLTLCVVGFCGNFFPSFLFTFAETGVSSGYAGMLNSAVPIFALLIGFVVFKERITSRQLVGVGVATLGVVCLTLAGMRLEINGGVIHVFAILLATFFYGVSLNVIKHRLGGLSGVEVTALSFLMILLPSVVVVILSDVQEVFQVAQVKEGVVALLVLSVVGTAFAVVLFNKLVVFSSVLFASSVTYLIPIFALIFGFLFGEQLYWQQCVSMLIVLLGVLVMNSHRYVKKG